MAVAVAGLPACTTTRLARQHTGETDDFMASGSSMDEILNEYPQLKREDILACIASGAEMSRERFISIPMEARP